MVHGGLHNTSFFIFIKINGIASAVNVNLVIFIRYGRHIPYIRQGDTEMDLPHLSHTYYICSAMPECTEPSPPLGSSFVIYRQQQWNKTFIFSCGLCARVYTQNNILGDSSNVNAIIILFCPFHGTYMVQYEGSERNP